MSRYIFSVISAGFFSFLLLLSSGCGGGDKEKKGPGPIVDKGKDGDKDKNGDKGTENRKPDFTLTADEIVKELTKDEKAGQQKFSGKLVEITGEVDSVQVTNEPWARVWLKGSGKHPAIFCVVSTDQVPKASQLSRKQKVKLTGTAGEKLGTYSDLDKCSLIELDKSNVIRITSEDFAKEFTADKKAAMSKYTDKDLIITGLLEEVLSDDKGTNFLKVKGDGKSRLSFKQIHDPTPFFKKGQTATLRLELNGSPGYEKNEIMMHSCEIIGAK